MTDTVALVMAAGRGERFGAERPKQYQPLQGQAVLRYSLARLIDHPAISAVRTVISSEHKEYYDEAAYELDLMEPVAGGARRQDSVRLGLESLRALQPQRVLIHDGARPLLSNALIDRVVSALESSEGALPVMPVTDTLKRGDGDRVVETVPRQDLWRAQTPQGFHYDAIMAAHDRAASGPELTDDAAVAEAAGLTVTLVEGAADNLKVTSPEDLEEAARRLGAGTLAAIEFRTGNGFDVHRFGPGDHVNLCGLRIAHDRSLLGHSDADVALHALTDAILGALAAGDIGTHFPPSDERWRGADSTIFLGHARDLVGQRNGAIVHVDLTLICEAPKLLPHRPAMVARLAEILDIAPERVSVKATTTEGLGFTGRREGIAAQASVTLRLPEGP